FDLTELARSLTAIYQLLPTYPCYDGGGGELAYVDAADIPHLDRTKAKAALDFHREIRAAVDAHLEDEAYVEGRYRLGRVVGIKQPTQQSAARDGDRLRLLRTIGGEEPDGDGTVPRPSATPLEYEDDQGAAFSAERHASLQNDDHVLLQLTGVLTGITINWSQFRAAVPMIDVSLDVDDLYAASEPVLVRARPDGDRVEDGLLAVAVDVETGVERARRPLTHRDDGWHDTELGPLPEGVYRVTVLGAGTVEPVTELVTVLAE
ncbi:MAG: hypothetical protein M3322_00415, partial [Actinomycetota bacterium]|nr:hypothetical protein [Actinomycetota bacterium]